MTNPVTDSDFLKLKTTVVEGFTKNDAAHERLRELSETHTQNYGTIHQMVGELKRANDQVQYRMDKMKAFDDKIAKVMFGDNGGGCRETQREHVQFLKGIKKMVWIFGTVCAGSFVAGVIAVAKHILQTT